MILTSPWKPRESAAHESVRGPRDLRPGVQRQLEAKRVGLFLDYDGTLTPIVRRPAQARLPSSVRALLAELAALCPLAIVSGRDRPDVERLVAIDGIIYVGSHGLDIAGPGGVRLQQEAALAAGGTLAEAARRLEDRLGDINGLEMERKRFSLAVHYRNVAQSDVMRVRLAVEDEESRLGELRLGEGKKVLELQPDVDWNKGKAVLWLLAELGLEGPQALPVYLGDDWTDEDAFVALSEGGLTFYVGELTRPTAARYHLKDTTEVEAFLSSTRNVLIKKKGHDPDP